MKKTTKDILIIIIIILAFMTVLLAANNYVLSRENKAKIKELERRFNIIYWEYWIDGYNQAEKDFILRKRDGNSN